MSRTAKIVVAAVVLALLAGGVLVYLQLVRKDEQTVTARGLPGMSQPGAQNAASDQAAGLVTATVSPAQEGREVVLQLQDNGAWKQLAAAEQDADGHVEFLLPTDSSTDGTYRVLSAGDGDLAEATSAPIDLAAWGEPDFVDEFERDELGPDWLNRGEDYNPEGLRACSRASGDAVAVRGGDLELSVVLDRSRATERCHAVSRDGKGLGNFPYRLNGHVMTNGHYFRYGVLSARIKFQPMRGQHGSLWMQPAISESTTDSGKGGAEIDVIEWFGKDVPNGGLASFIYMLSEDGPQKVGGWIEDPDRFLADEDDSWYDRYHVFSVEWTSQAYIFRIDGQETWRTDQGISHQPEYPILSLLSSDYELPDLGSVSRLPQTMKVDWIKFWQS